MEKATPAPNIVIHRATVDDAEALSNFMNVLADETLDIIPGLRLTPEEEREMLQKESDKERAFTLLALDGTHVAGALNLWAEEESHVRHGGRLGMSVLAPYRRKGIGRKLLETAIGEAKRWPGFCRIELEVVPWNEPAIRLYDSMGFVREGTKRKATNIRGKLDDMILMALVW